MHQLKSFYDGSFKDSHSHPIHTCFAMIASNEKSMQFGEICLFTLDSTQEIYIPSVVKKQVSKHTHTFLVKMVEILS